MVKVLLVRFTTGPTNGRVDGMLPIIMAILRSILAHIRPGIEIYEISVGGPWRPAEDSTVRITANIPVLY